MNSSRTLKLGPVTLGSERMTVIALLPPEALNWGAKEMAELRDVGASAACAPSGEVYAVLKSPAERAGVVLLVEVSTPEEALKTGAQEFFTKKLADWSRLASGSRLFFAGANDLPSAAAFFDTQNQIGLYPSWKSSLSKPWGIALASSGEESLSLALAGCTAGAQLVAYPIARPGDLEPLISELKSFSGVLGRELTRIPKKAEGSAVLSAGSHPEVRYGVRSSRFRVGFQGEHGAYSEMAVFNLFPQGQTEAIPYRTFREVFSAVLSGEDDFGMLPIENALAGAIDENFDLLLEFPDLHIVGETQVRIEHNLIGLPGAPLSAVKRVFSHPQGLAQSRQFLEAHPDWEAVPFYDTAGSVGHVAQMKDPSLAAIASAEAARVYGMEILVPGVETNHRNFTRFFLIAPLGEEGEGRPNKASVVFSTADEPGALSRCLAIFAGHGVNMKKLESRPIHGKPWQYLFYVDVELPSDPQRFSKAFAELEIVAKDCRLLGTYLA